MKAFLPNLRQVGEHAIAKAVGCRAATTLPDMSQYWDVRAGCGPEGTPSTRGGYA